MSNGIRILAVKHRIIWKVWVFGNYYNFDNGIMHWSQKRIRLTRKGVDRFIDAVISRYTSMGIPTEVQIKS